MGGRPSPARLWRSHDSSPEAATYSFAPSGLCLGASTGAQSLTPWAKLCRFFGAKAIRPSIRLLSICQGWPPAANGVNAATIGRPMAERGYPRRH